MIRSSTKSTLMPRIRILLMTRIRVIWINNKCRLRNLIIKMKLKPWKKARVVSWIKHIMTRFNLSQIVLTNTLILWEKTTKDRNQLIKCQTITTQWMLTCLQTQVRKIFWTNLKTNLTILITMIKWKS